MLLASPKRGSLALLRRAAVIDDAIYGVARGRAARDGTRPAGRDVLLRALTTTEEQRAELIGRLYQLSPVPDVAGAADLARGTGVGTSSNDRLASRVVSQWVNQDPRHGDRTFCSLLKIRSHLLKFLGNHSWTRLSPRLTHAK
jgi:hypothetical protein